MSKGIRAILAKNPALYRHVSVRLVVMLFNHYSAELGSFRTMFLFKRPVGPGKMLAFIVEATADMVPGEVGTAGLQDAKYVARASGSRAFWELLAQALANCNVSAVAVSLKDRKSTRLNSIH